MSEPGRQAAQSSGGGGGGGALRRVFVRKFQRRALRAARSFERNVGGHRIFDAHCTSVFVTRFLLCTLASYMYGIVVVFCREYI